jgi:hypothetical protein
MNWYGTCRSNYFHVQDSIAFEKWFSEFDGALLDADKEGRRAFVLHDGIPTFRSARNDDEDDDYDVDFMTELREHVVEGEAAIVIVAGAEGHRYITGEAYAVSPDHEDQLYVSLNDIYDLVLKRWKIKPVGAEY